MPTHSAGTFDKEHQLFFPTGEVFNQAKYAALQKWIAVNQAAFDWLTANLHKLRLNKRGYCSGSRIRSAFRDHYPGVVKVDEFKFNNNITKYLKFRIVFLNPDLHLFEFRCPPKHAVRAALSCPQHHCALVCPECLALA